MTSTALLTDRYELTMLDAALADGTAHRRCVFTVFGRRLPGERRYGVFAGTGRLLEALREFRFEDAQLAWLEAERVVQPDTVRWLADYRFSGTITGYREGELYFPESPLLTVEGTFAEAGLLETLVLSVLNTDSAIATAASRMVSAAHGRPLIEMGSRRTHEANGVAAARAAWIAGFAATSNLEAGRRWGVPTAGTSAHAFTLLHDSEERAFVAQVAAQGASTTLLVDTYDISAAVETAVRVAGPELGAVRIDSGDLGVIVGEVRRQLDGLGASRTRITVSGDLDEHGIAGLASAPVDAYGVGTSLVGGSGHPAAGLVYKLVAREGADGEFAPVAKRSAAKASRGGAKWAWRGDGAEHVVVGSPRPDHEVAGRVLTVPLVREGDPEPAFVGAAGTARAREHRAAALEELPPDAFRLSAGEPALPTVFA